MTSLWRVGPPTIGFLGVLAVMAATGWWHGFVAPAMAENAAAAAPEVSVDLGVLNSLDHGPAASGGTITLHPPGERAAAASDEHEPDPNAAARRGRRARAIARGHAARKGASAQGARADRGADARTPAAPRRSARDRARLKREEAARLRQARAEIAAAAHRTAPPQAIATAGSVPSLGPGPVPPPPPTGAKPESGPRPVASISPPAAPAVPPRPALAPKRAALTKGTAPAPHIDFAAGTADLTAAGRSTLDAVAQTLAGDGDRRVQLVAYATGAADEANQARRISLSRALNVRAYLIDHGVRNTRMDVRALGNRPDGSKPADRVEIVFLDK